LSGNWTAGGISDKARILSFLETDRLYAAYAIGDLEPGLFEQCRWAGAERDGRLQAIGLHFRGLDPAAYFLMGDPDGARVILRDALHPDRVYLTCRAEHLPAVGDVYAWEGEPRPMWRMMLRKRDVPAPERECLRMTARHADPIHRLIAGEGISGFAAAQIDRGVFFGIIEDGSLAAAAGTHLISPQYGVAGVGNVITRPDRRGRGYGKAVVAAVVAELIRIGIRDIVLNARHENAPAIHLYEKLGFERYCAFFEGPATRRMIGGPRTTNP
jgi:ribosomal protein S18 acetylase RimI-like enzyme